jgi:hypothetical protein
MTGSSSSENGEGGGDKALSSFDAFDEVILDAFNAEL